MSKRLKQLNNEEMKSRLKHQRTSNELVYFLRECQKTTGYYSKLNELKSNSGTVSSRVTTASTTLADSESSQLDSTSFYSSNSSKSARYPNRRPLTGKFRSTSYSNDQKSSTGVLQPEVSPPSLYIDTLTHTVPSKPTTSRSNSSVFSSNSSESLVAESSSSSSTVSRDAKIKIQVRPTIIRPQTAQLSTTKLFTKVSTPKILKNKSNLNPKSLLSDSTTVSNIDWYTSPGLTFDLLDDLNSNSSLLPKETAQVPVKSIKQDDFKSKSMNFSSSSSSSSSSSARSSDTLKSSILTSSLDLTSSKAPTSHKVLLYNRNMPIKINMSRASIRKKQLEIMNEYNRYNTLELLNNLRQIQKNLDTKVKQFANNTSRYELDSNA